MVGMEINRFTDRLLFAVRNYTEDEIIDRCIEQFPNVDPELLTKKIKKRIVFAKIRNLNLLISSTTEE